MAAVSSCYTVKVHSRFDAFLDNDISDDFPEEIYEKIQREKEVKEKSKKEKPTKKSKSAVKEPEKLVATKDNVKEVPKEKETQPDTPPENKNKSFDPPEKPPRFGGHKVEKAEDSENVPPQEFHSSSRGRGRGDFSGSRGSRGRGSRGDFGGSRGDYGGSRGDYGGSRGTEFRRGSRGSFRGGPRNDRGPREEHDDNVKDEFAGSSRGSRGSRGSRRGGGNRNRFGDQDHNDSEEMQIDSFVPESSDMEGSRPERPSRGRGGFRGRGRGGRGRGGRDFDRHSGSDKTGIKPTDKKEGGGAHNWGSVQDEVEEVIEQEEQETQEKADTSAMDDTPMPEDWADVKDDDAKQGGSSDAVVEMTLDEWKARQGLNRVHVQVNDSESFHQRKANDGKDLFGDMVAYRKPKEHKTEDDSDMEEMENEEDVKKKMIPIDIRFNDSPRRSGGFDRGGRGDRRGRGRGGTGGRFEERRGRGGGFSDRERDHQNDESAPRSTRGGYDGEQPRRGSSRGGGGGGGGGGRGRGDRERGRGSRGGRGGPRGGVDVNIRLDDELDFPTLK